MNEIIKGYEELYKCECYKNSWPFVTITPSQSLISPPKLMLIGRAPNGWEEDLDLKDACLEEYSSKIKDKIDNKDRWNWIKYENGRLTNINETYYPNKSPFWSYTKMIWGKVLNEKELKPEWMKGIIWTNLYKISDRETGNPTESCKKKQAKPCVDILNAEIEMLKPTHIIVMTGYNWIKDIKSEEGILNLCFADSVTPCVEGGFVEASGRYKGIKIIVTCRPERKAKESFANECFEYFEKI